MLFGRRSELEAGRRLVEQANEGRGGTLVVTGEPGIGKSALTRAIAEMAGARGARVAIGRAWEVGGAPAYWPFRQLLADLDLDLETLIGGTSGDMGAARRVVAFDRVSRAICALADARTVLLVLDDLHAADAATLELALAVSRAIARRRVAMVVTTRESELLEREEHAELVAKLAREGERVALRRLDGPAVVEWLEAVRYAGDPREVLRLSEGNPLFVEEAVRLGTDRLMTIAGGGASSVLREHVARISPKTRALLAIAAVLGRETSREEVAALAEETSDVVDTAVEEGVRVGVLGATRSDALAFSHVLLRDVLYASLPPNRRAELHARAAAIVERNAAAAAAHLLEAAPVVAVDEVVRAVVRAARAALDQHAVDAAMRWISDARRRLEDRLTEEHRLAFDLLRADAGMRFGPAEQAKTLAVACAETAKRLGRPEEQAHAALVYGLEIASGQNDERMVRLLEEALAALPPESTRLRARVLARLAAALVPPRSEEQMESARRHARDALALARAEDDPATLLFVLRFVAAAVGYTVEASERHALIEELLALARARGDDLTLVNVGAFYVAHLFERGCPAEARAEAEAYCAFVEALPLPQMRWRALATRASLAAIDARFDDARAHGDEMLRVAREAGARPGFLAWAIFQVSIALCTRDLERLAAIDDELVRILSSAAPLSPWLSCVHALRGRHEEARRCVEPVLKLARGFPWLVTAGQVALLLEDRELAARFLPLLESESLRGRFFWGPAAVFPVGPTSRILGELAALMGEQARARSYLDEAIAQCRDGAVTSLLELSVRARARLETGAPVARSTKPSRAISLTREGDLWVVSSSDEPALRVKHAKGFEYLKTLLAEPGREHHVLALASPGEGAEDAGAVLDDRAKAAYRRRLEDLQDQVEESERLGDAARAARARDEIDALADQLAAAVGLGGRDRRAASNVERARINVQRRIKDAIRRIAEQDAELARYLEATIRTGTYCCYEPV